MQKMHYLKDTIQHVSSFLWIHKNCTRYSQSNSFLSFPFPRGILRTDEEWNCKRFVLWCCCCCTTRSQEEHFLDDLEEVLSLETQRLSFLSEDGSEDDEEQGPLLSWDRWWQLSSLYNWLLWLACLDWRSLDCDDDEDEQLACSSSSRETWSLKELEDPSLSLLMKRLCLSWNCCSESFEEGRGEELLETWWGCCWDFDDDWL